MVFLARIRFVEPAEAEGKLAEIYKKFGGSLPNILKVHSLHPRSLQAHFDYYRAIMFGRSPLSRELREMIATVVSAENFCHY